MLKKYRVLLLVVLFLGLLFGIIESAFAIDKNVGEKYFRQYCSSCHGIDGRGTGPAAQALKTKPADLTAIIRRKDGVWLPEEVASKIDGRSGLPAHGSSDMPVWGRQFSQKVGGGELGEEFSRGNVAVLVEYLKSIQK